MVEVFTEAEAKGLGSSDLKQVAKAAFESRVETVFVEEGRIVPGKIDEKTGEIQLGILEHPESDDILDDLAELVLFNGGGCIRSGKDKMPCTTGIAAIYRYRSS
jgi:hypothetical protein